MEKGGIGRDLDIGGGWGKEKERKRVYTALDDALLALYKRHRGIIKESLYKGLIGLNMSLYSSKGKELGIYLIECICKGY